MTKEKILEIIKKAEQENGEEFDLTSDTQTGILFNYIVQSLDLDICIGTRCDISSDDFWLQTEYYSKRLRRTIIWDYEVGNFDDYDEVADYIIRKEKDIQEFEEKLPERLVIDSDY